MKISCHAPRLLGLGQLPFALHNIIIYLYEHLAEDHNNIFVIYDVFSLSQPRVCVYLTQGLRRVWVRRDRTQYDPNAN